MRPVRLFILGGLSTAGPMHGYQIRQDAQQVQTEWWADVKPGSLYSALHRMAAEGLVEVVRTEIPDASPQRTVYQITAAGRQALLAQRDEALTRVVFASDPLDLALRYVADLDSDELIEAVRARLATLVDRLARHKAAYSQSESYLQGLEAITFRHVLQRLRTEVAWHEELAAELNRLPNAPSSLLPNPWPTDT